MMDKHDGEDRDITRHKEHVKQQTGKKGGQEGQRIPHQEGLRIPHLRCQKKAHPWLGNKPPYVQTNIRSPGMCVCIICLIIIYVLIAFIFL